MRLLRQNCVRDLNKKERGLLCPLASAGEPHELGLDIPEVMRHPIWSAPVEEKLANAVDIAVVLVVGGRCVAYADWIPSFAERSTHLIVKLTELGI